MASPKSGLSWPFVAFYGLPLLLFFITFDFEPREKHFRREGGYLAHVEAAVGPADVAHVQPPVVWVPAMEWNGSLISVLTVCVCVCEAEIVEIRALHKKANS